MPFAHALALLTLVSGAGPLSELDAALARFTAREPVRARFTLAFENASGDDKDAVRTKGEVSGELAEGADGLTVTWPRALVDRARDEERLRAVDAAAKTPTRDAIAAASTLDLASQLDAAGALRQDLQSASVLEDRQDAVDGAPARLLVLKLVPALSARDRRYVNEVEARAKVWLGADGVPLAAEFTSRYSGRAFLVVSFKGEERQAWRFLPAGDRLVAVRHEVVRRNEGAGEKGERRSTVALTLAGE